MHVDACVAAAVYIYRAVIWYSRSRICTEEF